MPTLPYFSSARPTTLFGSGVNSSQTTIKLTSLVTPDGTPLTTAMLISGGANVFYLTIEPATTRKETISATGVTQNADGTATLTGCTRGLQFTSPYTASASLAQSHSGGSAVVISNSPQMYKDILNYIDGLSLAGTVPATNLVLGTTKLSVAAVDAGTPIAVGDNDPRVPTVAQLAYLNPVGAISMYGGAAAPTGWVLCNGASLARAGTYAALFAVIGTSYGAADGSHFNVPDLRSSIALGAGTKTKVATFASRASNVITVTGLTNAANNEFQTGQAVLYSAPSGAMTGLTHNTTYYIVRTGNLTFSLATSLANAQNGTVISLSSDGTGVQTFTLTLTARTVGDTGGEENHAMSSTELLAHTHTYSISDDAGSTMSKRTANALLTGTTNSTGGNAAMNVMNPFTTVSYIIKI